MDGSVLFAMDDCHRNWPSSIDRPNNVKQPIPLDCGV